MPMEFCSARWRSFMLIAFAFAAINLYIGATNLVFPAIVRLDHDGVHFRHWRMAWFVAWPDITEVHMSTIGINGIRAQANMILRDRGGTDRRVSSGLTISQVRLAGLIRCRTTFS